MKEIDIEKGSDSPRSSSSNSQVVEGLIGSHNEYLIRLMEKALEVNGAKIKTRPVIDKFKTIAEALDKGMVTSKTNNDLPSLLINAVLREKLSDRSQAEGSHRQKILLLVLTLVLPLVTNLLQFTLSYHYWSLDDGSD